MDYYTDEVTSAILYVKGEDNDVFEITTYSATDIINDENIEKAVKIANTAKLA